MGIKSLDVETKECCKTSREYTEMYLYNIGVSTWYKAQKVPTTKEMIGKFNFNKVNNFWVKI